MLIRNTLFLISFALVLGLGGTPSYADQSRGLVLESHVGARPRDADYLLSPLLDELKRNGFPGSSVAGTRIHSKHSLSGAELLQQDIARAKRDVKDAHAAYINLQFQGAVQTGNRAISLLMSRPATMARQQQVRELLYDALIIVSMAHSRLGNKKERDETMEEFIRAFPKRDVSVRKYGPEGEDLFRLINRRMGSLKKGELQIAAGTDSHIWVNERYLGMGSFNLELYPGQYRILAYSKDRANRVHIAAVEAERQHTLVVDETVDKSLRTVEGFVGLIFDNEEERKKEERRVTMELGNAVGAKTIILVGFHKYKGRDSIVASSLNIETGESGLSARVPLPRNGAPSAAQLRSLAAFVTGFKPASPGIEVFTVSSNAAHGARHSKAPKPSSAVVRESSDISKSASSDSGISSAWRWSSWGLGLAGLGAGGYLVSLNGTGTCSLQPGQKVCPESYDTMVPAIASMSAGVAFGILGFYFWTKEDPVTTTQLSVLPTEGGWSAALSGTF